MQPVSNNSQFGGRDRGSRPPSASGADVPRLLSALAQAFQFAGFLPNEAAGDLPLLGVNVRPFVRPPFLFPDLLPPYFSCVREGFCNGNPVEVLRRNRFCDPRDYRFDYPALLLRNGTFFPGLALALDLAMEICQEQAYEDMSPEMKWMMKACLFFSSELEEELNNSFFSRFCFDFFQLARSEGFVIPNSLLVKHAKLKRHEELLAQQQRLPVFLRQRRAG